MANENNNSTPNPTPGLISQILSGAFTMNQSGMIGGRHAVLERAGQSPYARLNKYDRGLTAAEYQGTYGQSPLLLQQYYRADNQGWYRQLWNGFWSRSASIPLKVGQMAAHAGGALAAATTDQYTMNDIWDNAMVKAMEDADEWLQEQLPVYRSKLADTGNFLTKARTTSWWATDGFDGLAFLASAYVPGAIAGKAGSLSAALQKTKYAKGLAKALQKTTKATGVNTQNLFSTIFNTAGEAGFEANEVNHLVRLQLAQREGYETFEQAPPEVQERIAMKAGEAAARTFWWNSAALTLPNTLQSRWLHGGRSVKDEMRDLVKAVRSGQLSAKDAKAKAGSYLAGFGKGVLSEGLWEENIQSAVNSWEERIAAEEAKTDPEHIAGVLDQYINNAWNFTKAIGTLGFVTDPANSSTDQAAGAILLGGLLGGGASLYRTHMDAQHKANQITKISKYWDTLKEINSASKNLFIEDVKSPFRQFGTQTIKDEEGNEHTVPNYLNENGEVELDQDKLYNLAAHSALPKKLLMELQNAILKQDEDWFQWNREIAMASHAYRMLKSKVTREDFNDLLQYDTSNIDAESDPLAEQMGYANLDREALSEYGDLFEQSTKDATGEDTLSDDRMDREFFNMMERNIFYLRAKKRALQKVMARQQAAVPETTPDTTPTPEAEAAVFAVDKTKSEIEHIDDMLNDMIKNRDKYRKDFDQEFGQMLKYDTRIEEIEKEKEDKKDTITPEEVEKLNKEMAKLAYLGEELQQLSGFQTIDYGTSVFDKTLPRYRSDKFDTLAQRFNVNKPLGRLNKAYYDYGKSVMNDIHLNELNNLDTDAESKLEFIEKNYNLGTDASIQELEDQFSDRSAETDTLKNQVNRLSEAIEEVENTEGLLYGESLSEEISPEAASTLASFGIDPNIIIEDDPDSRAIIENLKPVLGELEVELANKQQQVTRIDNLLTNLRRNKAANSAEIQMAQSDPEELRKKIIKDIIEERMNMTQRLIDEFDSNPENFLKRSVTLNQLVNTEVWKAAWEERNDVPDSLKNSIVKRLTEQLKKLYEMAEQIAQNEQARREVQVEAEMSRAAMFAELVALNLDTGAIRPDSLLYTEMVNAYGSEAELIKVLEGSKTKEGIYTSTGLQAVYLLALSKMSATQRNEVAKKLDSIATAEMEDLRKEFSSITFRGDKTEEVLKNGINKYGPYLISIFLEDAVNFLEREGIYYDYTQNKDLDKFRMDLSKNRAADGTYPNMSLEKSKQLDRLIEYAYKVRALDEGRNYAQSSIDVNELFTVYESIIDEIIKEGEIIPSPQQNNAILQLIITAYNFKRGTDFKDVITLKGVLGSGKSLVGAKLFTKIIRKLEGITDENIFAFAHTEVASRNIGSSVYNAENKFHTAEEFLAVGLDNIRVVIMDEAFAAENELAEAVHKKIADYNSKADNKNKVLFVAIGDPSQVTTVDPALVYFNTISSVGTYDTNPLSVIYRTGITSIADAAIAYRNKFNKVSELNTSASHTVSEALQLTSTDTLYGVLGVDPEENSKTAQQIAKELLEKETSKSRVVIVNNDVQKAEMQALVPNGVDVFTYAEAQSRQWDQVYLLMSPEIGNKDGNKFSSEVEYNNAMYTSVGRARDFVFIGDPTVVVKSIKNPNTAQAREDLAQDAALNKQLLLNNIESAKNVLAVNRGEEVTRKEPVETVTGTEENPTTKDKEDDPIVDETDLVEPEEEGAEVLDEGTESVKEPEPINIGPEPLPDATEFDHVMAHPSQRITYNGVNAILNDKAPVYFVKVESKNKYGVEYHAVARRKGGKYVSIAVIGNKDIQQNPRIYQLISSEKAKQAPAMRKGPGGVQTTTRGFELPLTSKSIIGNGTLKAANNLTYTYDLDPNSAAITDNVIEDALIKFYEGFFEASGTEPKIPLTNAAGEINWSGLAGKVRVAIFSSNASILASGYEDPNTTHYTQKMEHSYTPRVGVPYLVIEDPSALGATDDSMPQYIRLQPRQMNSTDSEIQTLRDGTNKLLTLENILAKVSPELKLGKPVFNNLIKDMRIFYEVDDSSGRPVIVRKKQSITHKGIVLTAAGELDLSMYEGFNTTFFTTEEKSQFMSTIDDLMRNHLYGIEWHKQLVFKEETAREFVKGKSEYAMIPLDEEDADTKYIIQDNVSAHKEGGEEPTYLGGWGLSASRSPMQRALNAIAKANKSIDDINIRITKGSYKDKITAGKSIIDNRQADGNFWNQWKAALVNFISETDARTGEATDMSLLRGKVGYITERLEEYMYERARDADSVGFKIFQKDDGTYYDNNEAYLKSVKEEMYKELATRTVNTNTLRKIVESPEKLRKPLIRHIPFKLKTNTSFGVNNIGSDLSNPNHRKTLNSALSSRFKQVTPTQVVLTIQGVTAYSPEQRRRDAERETISKAAQERTENEGRKRRVVEQYPQLKDYMAAHDYVPKTLLVDINDAVSVKDMLNNFDVEDAGQNFLKNLLLKELPDDTVLYQFLAKNIQQLKQLVSPTDFALYKDLFDAAGKPGRFAVTPLLSKQFKDLVKKFPEAFGNTNNIIIHNGTVDIEMLLHESLHVISWHAIRRVKNNEPASEAEKLFVSRLEDILKVVQENNIPFRGTKQATKHYLLGELVANLSNIEFREAASKVMMPDINKTIWQSLVESLVEFFKSIATSFGLNEAEYSGEEMSVFDATLFSLIDFLAETKGTQPEAAAPVVPSSDNVKAELDAPLEEEEYDEDELFAIMDENSEETPRAIDRPAIINLARKRTLTTEERIKLARKVFNVGLSGNIWLDHVARMLHEQYTRPTGAKSKAFMRTAESLKTAQEKGITPTLIKHLKRRLATILWDTTFSQVDKKILAKELYKEGLISVATIPEYDVKKAFADAFASDYAVKNKTLKGLRNRLQIVRQFSLAVTEYNKAFKAVISDLNKAHKNDFDYVTTSTDNKSYNFITKNFGNVRNYYVSKVLVLDAMSFLLERNNNVDSDILVKTKEELIEEAYQVLLDVRNKAAADISHLEHTEKSRKLTEAEERKYYDAKEQYAAVSILSRTTAQGMPLFYTFIREIYPNWTIKNAESISTYISIEDDVEAYDQLTGKAGFEGIVSETEDTDYVNVESRLTDSVKEFLSFLTNKSAQKIDRFHPNRYYSNRFTFLATVQIILDSLDLNKLELWDQQVNALRPETSLTPAEQAVFDNLDSLVTRTLRPVNDSDGDAITNQNVYILEESFGKSLVGFVQADQDITGLTYAEAKALPGSISIARPSTTELFDSLKKKGININTSVFNGLYIRSKSRNTLVELHNAISSLAEKNYKIGLFQNEGSRTYTVQYINAYGLGLNKSIPASIRHELHVYHETHGIQNLGKDPRIRQIKAKLKSSTQETIMEGIVEFLNFLNLGDLVANINIKAHEQPLLIEDIVGFLDRLSDAHKIEKFDIDAFIKDQGGLYTSISRSVKKDEDMLRVSSILDSNGNRLYRTVPKNFFYNINEYLTRTHLKWVKKTLPEYLKTEYFKNNIFLSGNIQTIARTFEHDATKNVKSDYSTPFLRESKSDWMTRVFSLGFLDSIESGRMGWYNHYLFQPADKPRIPGAEIRILNKSQAINGIEQMIRQMQKAPAYMEKTSRRKNYSKEADRFNVSVVHTYLSGKGLSLPQVSEDNIGEVAAGIYDLLEQRGKEYAKEIAESGTIITSKLSSIYSKLGESEAYGDPKYIKAANDLDSYFSMSSEEARKEIDVDKVQKAITPLAELFYVNYYINSYFLNQLYSGPYDYYKNMEEIVKRMAGVVGPGIRPFVNDEFGTPSKFRVAFIKDEEGTKDGMRKFLENILPEGEINGQSKEKRIEDLIAFFGEAYDTTDAQGFMLPERWEKLSRGMGRSYSLGNVMKPIHFQQFKHKNILTTVASQEEANEFIKNSKYDALQIEENSDNTFTVFEEVPVPVYMKYSTVKLSSELTTRFPDLKKIANFMRHNGIDEILFNSGVKVGAHADLVSTEEINAFDNLDPTMIGSEAIPKIKSSQYYDLDNEFYKLQLNPKSAIEKTVAIPTQLMYFLNILSTNRKESNLAYAAVSNLMLKKLEEIKDDKLRHNFKSFIASKLNSPGNEVFGEMLKSGISLNNPSIVSKAIIALMSSIESGVIQTRFRGAKLVLQSDYNIRIGKDPDIALNQERFKGRIGDRLQFVRTGDQYYAEAILPKSMLDEVTIEALRNGEDVYATPDLLGYRIPSTELHSAVPLKIVGIYDSADTNVLVIPYEIVYLHGSDFDVDSLFIIRREMLTNDEKELLGIDEDFVPAGYGKVNGKWTYNTDGKSNDLHQDYMDIISRKLKAAESASKEASPDVKQFYVREERHLKKLSSDITDKVLRNAILDTLLSTVTKPVNRQRMATPIVMSEFNDTKNPNSLASFLGKHNLWEETMLSDLSTPEDSYKAFESMRGGTLLTGVFANNVKSLAYMSNSGVKGMPKIQPKYQFSYKIGDQSFLFDRMRNADVLSKDGYSMWMNQDALINLAIDNLKEQTLLRIGITESNGNAYSALLSLGMPKEDVSLLFLGEDIKKLSREHNANFIAGQTNLRIRELIAEYDGEEGIRKLEASKSVNDYLETLELPILSREDLIKIATGKITKSTEDVKLKIAALVLFKKSLQIGDSLKNMSSMLNVLRTLPVTPEDIDKWYTTRDKVFKIKNENQLFSYSYFKGMSLNNFASFIGKAGRNVDIKVQDGFAYIVPNLLNNHKHITTAIRTFTEATNFYRENFYIHSKEMDQFIHGLEVDFNKYARVDKYDLREEIGKILLSTTQYEDIVTIPSIKRGLSGTTKTSIAALNEATALLIGEAQKLDSKLAKSIPGYKRNRFISQLITNRYKNNWSIRMAGMSNVETPDIIDMRGAFERLGQFEASWNKTTKQYELTYEPNKIPDPKNPSLLQKYLIMYAVLNTGFRFGSTSYTTYLPEEYYIEMDRTYDSLLWKFVKGDKSKEMQAELRDMISNALAFKYVEQLPQPQHEGSYLKRIEVRQDGFYNTYSGKTASGEYFHAKYKNVVFGDEPMSEAELASNMKMASKVFPKYTQIRVTVRDPQTGEPVPNKYLYDVYYRITPDDNLNDPYIYYQRMGRAVNTGHFVKNAPYSNSTIFNPKVRPIFMSGILPGNTFISREKIEVGEVVRAVLYDDPLRIHSPLVRIKSVQEQTRLEADGEIIITGYLYEFDLVEPSSQTTQPEPPKGPEQGLFGDLLFAVNRDTDWEVFEEKLPDGTEVQRFYINKRTGQKVVRVTAKVDGLINKLRARPYTDYAYTPAHGEADARWKNLTPETKLNTLHGYVTKDEFIEKETAVRNKRAAAGTLTHLHVQYAITEDKVIQARLEKEMQELYKIAETDESRYAWIHRSVKGVPNYVTLLREKVGINIYDNIPESEKDEIASEVTIVDTNFFNSDDFPGGLGGTVDLMVKHADGKYSFIDFKSGWGFNHQMSQQLFKYGAQIGNDLFQNPRETGKLQLMIYAFLYKLNNPEVQFKELKLAWIPSAKQATMKDHKEVVEVEDYLNLIHQYLRNEQPDIYNKIKEAFTENQFANLFNPSEYHYNPVELTEAERKAQVKTTLQSKLDELQRHVLFSTSVGTSGSAAAKSEAKKKAKDLMEDIIKLVNDVGLDLANVKDISFMSLYLSNTADSNSAYIQLYDKIFKEGLKKSSYRIGLLRSKFRSLMQPLIKDYEDKFGSNLTKYIPFAKNAVNLYNTEDMWGWLYVDVMDKDGQIIGERIRETAEEWAEVQRHEKWGQLGEWEARKNMAKFLRDTYDSYFLDAKARDGKALANRIATYTDEWGKHSKKLKEITNLELHNKYREQNRYTKFEYASGWFPRVPKMLEEFGTPLKAEWWTQMYRKHWTMFEEANFELDWNEIEAVPIKYLGNEWIDSSRLYSRNAEYQFDLFTRNMEMKDALEDAYAFGKGLQLYLNISDPENPNKAMYENTIEFLEKQIDMQVRNRDQRDFSGGFVQRNIVPARLGTSRSTMGLSWVKIIRNLTRLAAAPIMWLKPLQGTANGIFITMYSIKEAIKDSVLKSGKIHGIDGDQVSFTIKDLAWANKEWVKMQGDAMKGDLANNKMFLLAQYLGYMPDNYYWSSDINSLSTTRNHAFSESTMYMFHKLPEEMVALTIMAAQLRRMKAGDKSVWDRYQVVKKTDENGNEYSTIEWDGYVRGVVEQADGTTRTLTELDGLELKRLYYVYQKLNGGYRSHERPLVSYFAFGKMGMQFKRYLPAMLRQMLGSKARNLSYGAYKKEREGATSDQDVYRWHARVMEGRFRVLAGLLLNVLNIDRINFYSDDPKNVVQKVFAALRFEPLESYKWKNLEEGQREIIVDFATTMTMWAALMGGFFMLFSGADEDDPMRKYYLRIANNFVQPWEPTQVMKDVLSANGWAASAKWVYESMLATSSLAKHGLMYYAFNSADALTDDNRLKGWTQFARHTVFLSSYYDMAKFLGYYSESDDPWWLNTNIKVR